MKIPQILTLILNFHRVTVRMQFSIHSNIYTCFSPHNGTLKKAYSSFLKLHITNQRCILNKKLHSSNSNPGKFQEFNFGRSSDLLHFPNALPISPKRDSGFEYCRKTSGGAYSSGSVQDLHLIPFSPFFRSIGRMTPKFLRQRYIK